MTELKMEHVLMLAVVAFVLYHFMGRCSCDGFRVGGQDLVLREDGTYWDVDQQLNPDIRFREQCCGPNGVSDRNPALGIKAAQCLQYSNDGSDNGMQSGGIPEATERWDNARPLQPGSPFYTIAAYHKAATALDNYCKT